MIPSMFMQPELAHNIRLQWFEDLPIDDMDDIRFINDALRWLRKNGELPNAWKYRIVFSRDVKRLTATKKIVLDLHMVRIRRQKKQLYHAFLIRECVPDQNTGVQ